MWQWTHQWQLRVSNQCSNPTTCNQATKTHRQYTPDIHRYSCLGWWWGVDECWVATLNMLGKLCVFVCVCFQLFISSHAISMKCHQFPSLVSFVCVLRYSCFPYLNLSTCTELPLLRKKSWRKTLPCILRSTQYMNTKLTYHYINDEWWEPLKFSLLSSWRYIQVKHIYSWK